MKWSAGSKLFQENNIKRLSNVSLIVISISVVFHFFTFFQMKLDFESPFISSNVICMVYEYYAFRGLLLSIGLFVSVLFRVFDKRKVAFINDVLWYAAAHLINLEYIQL